MQSMISNKDTIVAIWVTNKPKFRNFIINKLFPSWKLECVSEWVWLKMTTQGECIFPIDSEHKKPYEQLIIGRPIASSGISSRISMPESHIIVSVPSTRHSRKPPLHGMVFTKITYTLYPNPFVNRYSQCLPKQQKGSCVRGDVFSLPLSWLDQLGKRMFKIPAFEFL